MTSPQRFEHDLPMLLDGLYLAGTPDYRDDLVGRIARTPQRPAWTFPERWLPMDIATQAVPTARMPWRQLGVVALLAVLLAAAAAVYVGTQPRPPEPFGLAENGQLTYITGGDVYVRDSLFGAERLLMQTPETETWAMFSPLGDRLAILREVDSGEDLWVGDADGSDLIRIGGPYRSLWLEWSPDQTLIAVSHVANGFPRMELVATDASGSRRLVDMPAESPTFRPPDGRQLVFRGQADGRWSYYLIDVAGGEPVRLEIDGLGLEGGGYDLFAPTWSPNGDRIAFHTLVPLPESQGQTNGFRLSVASIGPDGTVTSVKPLEFDPFSDDELNPVFTPDGASIIFQQRFGLLGVTDYTDAAWIAPADGNGPATPLGIESTNGDGFAAAIAPDGTSVVVHLFKEQQDWSVDPATGEASLTDLASGSGVSWQRRGASFFGG
jgi:dipeptidyl aminopeptidase/acylaminoacyl peptidase